MASVRTKGSGRGRAASCQQGVREARVNLYYVVAIWMAMALAASLISIRIAIPVALVEIVVGAVAAVFRLPRRERAYTTLLMATGLTFGSIAALFGLTHGLFNERQYTEL